MERRDQRSIPTEVSPKQELFDLSYTNTQLTRRNTVLEERMAMLELAAQADADRIADLAGRLGFDEDPEIKAIVSRNNILVVRNDQLVAENADLVTVNRQLTDQVQTVQDEADQAIQEADKRASDAEAVAAEEASQRASLEARVELTQKLKAMLSTENKNLRIEAKDAVIVAEEAMTAQIQAETDASEVKEQLSTVTAERDDLATALEDVQSQNVSLVDQVNADSETIAALTARAEDAEAQVEEERELRLIPMAQQPEYAFVYQGWQEAVQALAQQTETLAAAQKDNQKLNTEIGSLTAEVEKLTKDLAKEQRKVESIRQELNRARGHKPKNVVAKFLGA